MKTRIEELCYKFFELIKIDLTSIKIACEDEEKNIFFIHIETPDSKILIWTHWQTLESIKHILSRMIEHSFDTNVTIHLEVNDYQKSKDEKLFRFIDSKIDFVIKSKKEISLPNFSAYERKKIHSYISDKNNPKIRSYSVWDWKKRVMHLAFSDEKIAVASNIDIDWIDI